MFLLSTSGKKNVLKGDTKRKKSAADCAASANRREKRKKSKAYVPPRKRTMSLRREKERGCEWIAEVEEGGSPTKTERNDKKERRKPSLAVLEKKEEKEKDLSSTKEKELKR